MTTLNFSKNQKIEPSEKRYANKFLEIIKKNRKNKLNLSAIPLVYVKEINFAESIKCTKPIFYGSEKCSTYITENPEENPDFNGSNIKKFLYCLNNTVYGIRNNVRVVCHSRLMKKFLSEFTKTPLENKIADQNLWSMLIEGNLNDGKYNNDTKIIISRHGYTFANLLKQKGNKTRQILEKDARLTIYGILISLLHSNDLRKIEEYNDIISKPSTIYVSVLSRTWMTAICLYLPFMYNFNFNQKNKIFDRLSKLTEKSKTTVKLDNLESKELQKLREQYYGEILDNTFNLIISPYLKEDEMGLDNTPKEFTKQVNDIILFLDFLVRLDEYYSNQNNTVKQVVLANPANQNGSTNNENTLSTNSVEQLYSSSSKSVYGGNSTSSKLNEVHQIIKNNVSNIIKFFENKGNIYIRYMNKDPNSNTIAIIVYDKQNKKFTYNSSHNRNFHGGIYQKSNNILSNVNIKIYEGENKPSNKNSAKFTRWCEPLSEKEALTKIGYKSTNCEKRLKSMNIG